jgi:predicted flap endonuclease-1-like 5' DNA nuclease/predicted  nucleic acid-binding Zn-ribbon protein
MITLLGIFDSGWWNACTKNATLEVLLMLFAAGVIGWLLHHYWGSGSKKVEAEWQGKYDKLGAELSNAQKNNKKLRTDFEAGALKLASIGTLSGDNDKLKSQLASLQLQFDNLNKEYTSAKTAFASEKQSLQTAASASGDVELYKNRAANLTEELNNLKKTADTYKTSLDAANVEKLKLTASLQGNETEDLRKKISKLESDLNSSRLLVTQYQNETKKLDDRKAAIEAEGKQVSEQRTELDSIKSKLSKAEEDLTKARTGIAELSQLKNDYEELKKQTSNANEEMSKLAKTAADASVWKEKATAIENDLDKSNDELAKLKVGNAALQTEKNNFAADLAAAKNAASATDGLTSKVAELQAANTAFSAELSSVKNNAGDTAALNSKIEELKDKLHVNESAYATLHDKYEILLTEKSSMKVTAPIKYDDLEIIEGIGPKIEKILYNGGIHTFCQLAETPAATISEILIKEGGEKYKMHDPGTWPEQAALLCAGKKEEFEKLAAELKGGKRVAAPEKKDDLKVIEGIGPKIEELLHGGGIYSYRQLANAPAERLKEILIAAGERYKMHDPTTWPQQSALLADGKMEEFQKLTDSLKGGRVV